MDSNNKLRMLAVVAILAAVAAGVTVVVCLSKGCNCKCDETTDHSITESLANNNAQTWVIRPMMTHYFQGLVTFLMNDSKSLGMKNEVLSPALVAKEGGSFKIILSVAYDQKSCKQSDKDLSSGTVHLVVKLKKDNSTVNHFKEDFTAEDNLIWTIDASMVFDVNLRPGEGILIFSSFTDCILKNKTYLKLTKLN